MKKENKSLNQLLLQKANNLKKQQINWRRHLHQYPELSNQEFETTKFIKKILSDYQIPFKKIPLETGVIAEVKGKQNGSIVAIRSDIDALPILEQTNLPFKSKNRGCMHACGHDLHMATVLGTAVLLNDLKEHLHGTVRFIFQPAEEMPPGGARPMIEAGCLDKVKMIFGMHNDPHLKTGSIGLRDGIAMASVTDFDIKVIGQGGHAARPQNAVDAIVVASEIIGALQKVVSREVDPIQPVVVTIGTINGGTARNVICDEVTLVGTARTLSKEAFKQVPKRIKQIAESIAKAHKAKIDFNLVATYPVLENDIDTNNVIRENFESLFGKNKIEVTPQVMGGEDFACYLEKTKGAMFRLGVMNKKIKADKSWHSPEFIVDEDAIPIGTATFASSALNYLYKIK
ncbi:MAG: amidohydrolase [Calditrichaeota bacterium]|nr:MAG: amidohydrolase [Calditrichota bacterium]